MCSLFIVDKLTSASGVTFQIKREVDFENKTPMEQLFISFMTSLTITALNSIVPIVFKKLVTWEGYSFAIEVNFTLGR